MFNGRIALSPQEIFDKDFKIDTRGYRLQEVDKYLDQIIKDYVEFINIIKELKTENKELSRENMDLKHELRNLKANIDIVKKSEKEIKILMKKYKMPDSICDNPKQQIGYWFENGVQLSGGQWQRLAICRTMARDNEILLLDEPNAALDAITFRMLYNEINAQANRKVCVMLLQHFVNFIGGSEEICVFDDGKLISRGKHDRLYDTCRIYKELYDAQQ